jgi:hypothetical protein
MPYWLFCGCATRPELSQMQIVFAGPAFGGACVLAGHVHDRL